MMHNATVMRAAAILVTAAALATGGCDRTGSTSTEPVTGPTPAPSTSASQSSDTPAPDTPAPSALRRPCPDLPATRPEGFVVRYAIHDNDRPEALQRWVIHAADVPCPPDDMPPHLLLTYQGQVCAPLAPADLDALYADLRRLGADRIRVRSLPEWPHRAGPEVQLTWAEQSCRLGDVSNDIEPAPEDRESFHAVDGAVREAIRRALGQSGSAG